MIGWLRNSLMVAMVMLLPADIPAAADLTHEEAEIARLIERYWTLFSADRPDEIAADIYRAPVLFPTDSEMILLESETEIAAFFSRVLEDLGGQGYSHSELRELETCVLSDTKAIASTRFARRLTDGRIMGPPRRASTYLLHKLGGEWRIVAAFPHDANRLAVCS